MPPTAIFLDLDGVLVDLSRLPAEYVRLLGDVLAAALGETPERWGEANREVFPRVWSQEAEWGDDPLERLEREATLTVRGMCEWLGVDPPTDEECVRLGRELHVYVRSNHDAIFDHSARVVRALAPSYDFHLATGNPSWCGGPQLDSIGVRDCFGLLCGPDLVGVRKRSPLFYPRLFELAGVAASEAVVVDDEPQQLARAVAAGARTVLVHRSEPWPDGARIANIAELPATIAELSSTHDAG